MASSRFTVFTLAVFSIFSLSQKRRNETGKISFTMQVGAANKLKSSPFESALDTLQNQTGYAFKNIGYLRRAMTHSSFSEENNKALSILESNDAEISSKDLNRRIADNSKVDTSCAVDGMRLGLHRVVRVSPKTNSTTPLVVCSAFRALFGAIAIDTKKADDAGIVFWKVHGREVGKAMVM
ncbi:hypothetical protein H0E87_025827 [Populus deltoides]|uniref:RNase III domain-containing protein n=1 Tax=Populus deltoides TaxID=3696 RepID=A0A8T2X1J9_POPDE|nr:hypothetical protein H0E87_025827 [Populus deltoides]